jgi:pimeloyl-ACP methyl ester carboxylesterase
MFKYLEERNRLTKIISIVALLALVLGTHAFNSSFAYALEEDEKEPEKLQNIILNPSPLSSSSKPSYSILDPNPSLIDKDGNLISNISLAASIPTYRSGTIADGVSKLILLIESNNTLQFSINDTKSDDLTNGALSSLNQENINNNNLSSTTIVNPQNISNGKSIVAAVYIPPNNIGLTENISHRTINILTNNTNNSPISIQLYRPPVVLVHGLWTNSNETWVATNFTNKLTDNGFIYAFAYYEKHNSDTFDPYANKTIGDKPFGNYGIDSIRNAINYTLNVYHYFSIAASQVDIVAHSMGGLMARGFVQQPDYVKQDNFMKGSIHRLITIGIPHFGTPLFKFLYDHRDDWYCFNEKGEILPAQKCNEPPMQLKTFYGNYNRLIEEGAVKSLIPGSDAYSHLCQTNVSSYAIAGSWRPNANVSHGSQESYYKNITDNKGDFNLDRKDGFNDDNDLVVSITSQLGGLQKQIRQPGSNGIPNQSALYPNTVHVSLLITGDDKDVFSETNSPHIQQDIIRLLGSSDDNKFADAIGRGSLCHVPKQVQ